jgi:hypothetical protein
MPLTRDKGIEKNSWFDLLAEGPHDVNEEQLKNATRIGSFFNTCLIIIFLEKLRLVFL